MGHLIPMAFNSIIIILIGNADPWALMGKNVTVIVSLKVKKKWNVTVIALASADPGASMAKNVTVILATLTKKK